MNNDPTGMVPSFPISIPQGGMLGNGFYNGMNSDDVFAWGTGERVSEKEATAMIKAGETDEPPSPTGGNESKIAGSWTPDQPLPKDPSELGPDWTKDTVHKPEHGKRWINDKGEKLDFDKGQPGERGDRGKDHWHYTPPDGKRGKEHYKPGQTLKMDWPPTLWDRLRSIPPQSVVEAGTTAIIMYLILSEGSRFIPWRNLIPVP
jgi:hypothetical protein